MILNCPLVSVGSYLFLCVSLLLTVSLPMVYPVSHPTIAGIGSSFHMFFFFFNGEFLSCYSNFLPHPKDMCVRLTGDFKLT